RPHKITVEEFEITGKKFKVTVEDFIARAFCHEYDHLDGVLYIDKATDIKED
ncbi:MAG: peptide deformylase, partial [Clostridia bacterium]|nr:peptide deformylase [Clostridia bacterium]